MTARPANADARRRRAERLGRRAEWLAAAGYIFRGFRLCAMRYRTPAGEIDLVMRRGRLFAFVEVKARASLGDAVDAVAPKARRRIERAARAFLARQPDADACAVRYDIVAVSGWRVWRLCDAWRDGE